MVLWKRLSLSIYRLQSTAWPGKPQGTFPSPLLLAGLHQTLPHLAVPSKIHKIKGSFPLFLSLLKMFFLNFEYPHHKYELFLYSNCITVGKLKAWELSILWHSSVSRGDRVLRKARDRRELCDNTQRDSFVGPRAPEAGTARDTHTTVDGSYLTYFSSWTSVFCFWMNSIIECVSPV